jgi:ATP-dependent helicase/DNAse subunit B
MESPMRTILLGEPGSGKTTEILASLRSRIERGDAAFRLLTPTATMAEHLRNQLARQGLLVRPKTITTLARFVHELVPARPTAGPAEIRLLLAQLLAEQKPASLTPILESPGLPGALARAIDELANAGCDSLQWESLAAFHVYSGGVLRDLGLLYRGLEDALRQRGLLLRSQQVLAAAQAAPAALTPLGIDTVCFDGFYSLTLAERQLAAALASRASVLIALPAWPGAQPSLQTLAERGFQIRRCSPIRTPAQRVAAKCPDDEALALDVARRIRALAGRGVPWREIGVIVRSPDPWAPRIENALARFGIPYRSYFSTPLTRHPVYRLFADAIQAAAAGFPPFGTLPVLVAPVSLAGADPERDPFEYHIRKFPPAPGLPGLREHTQPGRPLRAAIDVLDRFAAAAAEPAPPADWPARLALLQSLVAPPDAAALTPQSLAVFRARAAAIRGFQSALAEAARLLPPEPMDLERFWRLAEPALAEVSLRPLARERDAVALLDVQEARQWELPYVFLCGLVEGEFPRHPQPDPVLNEDTRQRLADQKIPVSRLHDRDEQESFLFEVALTRATSELVLLYPARDAKGDATLPSFKLQRLGLPTEPAPPVRLFAAPPLQPLPVAQSIQDPGLLQKTRAQHRSQRPTAIETFLSCPYRFHARHTLRLQTPPPLPSERLDASLAGSFLHDVINEYHRTGGDPEEIFQRLWTACLRQQGIREGYRSAGYELQLRRSLQLYLEQAQPQPGLRVLTEEDFAFTLTDPDTGESLEITGRIDRFDQAPDGACEIYDLKYASKSSLDSRVKRQQEGLSVQGGLYTLALEARGLQPQAFHLLAVRGDVHYATQRGQDLVTLKQQARASTLRAAREIAHGRIEPAPSDERVCGWCDFADTCRIQQLRPAAAEQAS